MIGGMRSCSLSRILRAEDDAKSRLLLQIAGPQKWTILLVQKASSWWRGWTATDTHGMADLTTSALLISPGTTSVVDWLTVLLAFPEASPSTTRLLPASSYLGDLEVPLNRRRAVRTAIAMGMLLIMEPATGREIVLGVIAGIPKSDNEFLLS